MAIVQISKIQQRSGNLVDLPQLDEAEFGWASDAKLLYIGKTTPNENVEVLTSYSHISFSQLDGAVGNLNISDATVANGQVLAFDGTNWVNKGGDAGGLITLGSVANVKITGGAIGYVLETDGTGNLSWTPKGTISASILTVTNANPGVVTTTTNNLFTDGIKVTITDSRGMTQLNGNTYYADVLSSNTFALYTDASLSTPLNTSAFTAYAYTNVSNTFSSNNALKVGNTSSFTVNYPIKFVGDMTGTNLGNTATYYIKTIPSSTAITVSSELLPNGIAGNTVVLNSVNGLTANVYETGGRILSSLVSSGGGGGNAAGAATSVQYNAGGLLGGSSDFTFDNSTKIATVNGNINTSNVNASNAVTASRLVSNVATGTAPLTVTSTTLVPNLFVARSNISEYNNVSAQTTGTFYPVFVNGNTTSNYALSSNTAFSFNAATGLLSTGALTASGNITANNLAINNVASIGATLSVTGNITAPRFISTIATGNAPLTVNSTTRVPNLNVAYANVSDFGAVNVQTTGTFYPVLVNSTANANYALASNAALSINLATGVLTASGYATTGNVSSNNISISNVANVGANLNVTGDTNLTGRLTTAGNVSFTGATVNLGGISNVKVTGGTNGYVITTDGAGNLSFANPGAVVASPAGANTQIQFNDNGTMGANAGLTFVKATGNLAVTGNISSSALISATTLATSGNANIGSNLNVTGNAIITANANVTGSLNIASSAFVTANVNANNLSISNNATVGATLTVSGNANVGAALRVTGTANAGNLETSGYATVTGNITAGNLVTSRTVSAGNISVTNNITAGGTLTVTGNVSLTGANISLGSVSNVTMTGGASGYVLITDGTGNLSFSNPVTIGTQPAGANTQVQFNDGGALGATANFTFTKTTNNLYSGGNVTAVAGLYGAILSTTGNANVNGNINVGANALITLSANIGGSLDVSGAANLKSNLVVAGNVTSSSGRFIGNGAGLTNLTGSNVVGTVDSATTAATVTTAAQPNITSVTTSGGTLTIGATSNGGTYVRKSIQIINSASDLASGAQIVLAFAGVGGLTNQANSTWNLDVNGSNNFRLFSLDATGTLGTPITAYSSNSDVLFGSNVNVSGRLNSTGNVTAPFFIGSGATLTSVPGGNVTGTVANAAYATNSGTASSVAWTNVSGRPTALSSFTNDVGYITTPVPSGTNMLFYQASAPTGWTKVTTSNDAALRVVSGSGGGTGGTVNFSSAFTSQAVSGIVGDTSLTELQMPSHYHYTVSDQVVNGGKVNSSGPIAWSNGNNPGEEEYELAPGTTTATLGRTSSTGGSQSHTHTFSGTSINLAVKYIDVIIAYKN